MSPRTPRYLAPAALFAATVVLGAVAGLWLQYGPSIFLTLIETGLAYCF